MKHFSSILTSFLKIAIETDWWKKLTRDQQLEYLKLHRKTKLRPVAPSVQPGALTTPAIKLIFKALPKPWKQELASKGIGENSEVTQLSTGLRARQLKEAMSTQGTNAIIALQYENNKPLSELTPAFIIESSSYKEDKFTCRQYAADVPSDQGQGRTSRNPNDAKFYQFPLVFEPRERYNRRHGRSYTDNKTDLRMSAIVEKLPDKPYMVFAIKIDPERMKSRQQRSDMSAEISGRRDVEEKLISNAVEPIYNYYADKLKRNVEKLKDASLPTFDDVLKVDLYYNGSRDKTQMIIDNIKTAQEKLAKLSSEVKSFRSWRSLPREGQPYSDRNADDRKRFMKELEELKGKFKVERSIVTKNRCIEASKLLNIANSEADMSIRSKKLDNISSLLDEVDVKDVAQQVDQLKGLELADESYLTKLQSIISGLTAKASEHDNIIESARRY